MKRTQLIRTCGIAGTSVTLLAFALAGCGREQPPPAAPPAPAPAATAPAAPAGVPAAPGAAALQLGMSTEQVRQVMGAPTAVKQEGTQTEWKYYTAQGKVEIKFVGDRASKIERE